ncbi:MAG TPA: cytochrome c [Burkholderiales bacterium]|nr:cytochrome c [Burkholderiales bacterium]
MNKRLTTLVFAAVAGTAVTLPAFGQAKPDTLVKQRQSAMVLQGKYFGPLNLMAQGKIPYNQQVVVRNAAYLDALSKMPWDGFTDNTKGEKSRALPAVFSDSAKFKQAYERFESETSKLAQVSRSGDEASVKSQIAAVDKACSACHDDFRERR